MALTIQFIGAETSAVSASSNAVDISGIPIVRGDLAIAMLAFGNPAAAPNVTPQGWTRVTGARIDESVELSGELLVRTLLGDEQSFTFTAQAGSTFAAAVVVYRNVSGVDATQFLDETVEAGPGSNSHSSPPGESDVDALAVMPYFFWYEAGAITPDAATSLRASVEVVAAPHRSITLALADEQISAGPAASRTTTTAGSGLANMVLLVLTPAVGERSPFDTVHGIGQGRIEVGAIQGRASFVLGHIDDGAFDRLNIGDYQQVVQKAELAGSVLRVRARLRYVETPPGVAWEASLLIDGVKRVRHVLRRDEEIELAANVSALAPGDHVLALRLEVIAA